MLTKYNVVLHGGNSIGEHRHAVHQAKARMPVPLCGLVPRCLGGPGAVGLGDHMITLYMCLGRATPSVTARR